MRTMTISKEMLKELQAVETDILKHTIEICDKLNLKYYLLGGTLLGAVRHRGFIPWDDDIDIGMPRADYEIFVKEAQRYYPGNVFVQHYTTEKNMPVAWCKIRRSDTAFMESSIRSLKINKGIFIDVFPLDTYPDSDKERKKIDQKDRFYKTIISKAYTPNSVREVAAKIKNTLVTLFFSYKKAVAKKDQLHKESRKGAMIANYNGAWGKKEIVPAEWYGEGEYLLFENIKCRVPAEYDKWLTQVYGDYMTLPPKEKRITHHDTDYIDLSKSYLEYEAKK